MLTKTKLRLRRIILFTIVLHLCLLFTTCRSIYHQDFNAAKFEGFYKKADSVARKVGPRAAIAFTEAAFDSYKDASTIDIYTKYDNIRRLYLEYHLGNLICLAYDDSMLRVLENGEVLPAENVLYASTFITKGDDLITLQRYEEAYFNYYKGQVLMRSTNDSNLISNLSGRLGYVYYNQGKYLEAAHLYILGLHFGESMAAKGNIDKIKIMQTWADDVGLCYAHLNFVDSAEYYYNSALRAIKRYAAVTQADSNWVASASGVTYGNLGDIMYKKGDINTAENLYRQSIYLNTIIGSEKLDAELTLAKLSELYLSIGKLNKADSALTRLKAELDTLPNIGVKLKLLKMQSIYAHKTNNSHEAFGYLQDYFDLKDSLDNKPQPENNATYEFQKLEQEHAYNVLANKNELQTKYLAIAVGFVVLIIVIALQTWKNLQYSKKSNALITLQKAQLEQSNNNYIRIIKILGHDLKNPLAGIIMLTDNLLEREELTANNRNTIELINRACNNSVEMIEEILDANLNNRSETITREFVAMYQLLKHCADILKAKANQKQQQIIISSSEEIVADVNHEKMWRVINNLIVNAIKFSPLYSTILLQLRREGEDRLLIMVQDYGIGIPDKIKDKIFDVFTDATRTGTLGEKAYGLGLSICKQIVEAHGGKIWLESEEGKGTTFFVQLPIK